MKRYLYGAGGHAKVVMDAMGTVEMKCDGFVDDKPIASLMGLGVFPESEINQSEVSIHLAIGNIRIREGIVSRLDLAQFFSVIHKRATLSLYATIGEGSFVAAGAIIAPAAMVGKHCIINHSAIVDHDCEIGDYSHIAPTSTLGGAVKVGRGVFVGAGAIVLPNVTVGDYAVIGAGSVVTKDVGEGLTVVGSPAIQMK